MIVGFTVFEKLKKQFDFKKYNEIYVIITHLHNDHAGSLSQFILYMWFVYQKKVIVVSKCEKIKEYLKITGTIIEAYEVKERIPGLEFIKTEHVDQLDSYGFYLEILDKSIVYTGDTKTLQPFLPYLKNSDEFYVDISKFGGVHLKFEDVIEDLKQIKRENTQVILMHIDDIEYIKKINNGEFII